MGIIFYVVRSRQGGLSAVQTPSPDCEVLATIAPPSLLAMGHHVVGTQ